ncbi:MAG: hypothetical protein GF331_18555, partial [Chitinivibrionales bacterium]|nr:hypothetical protein [Chitinivibrionales bacterium]
MRGDARRGRGVDSERRRCHAHGAPGGLGAHGSCDHGDGGREYGQGCGRRELSASDMDTATFSAIRELVHRQSGISLRPGKEAMVRARLGKRMRILGIERHRDYLDFVVNDTSGQELVHLIDAICTNVTSFFRESDHFGVLSELM